jgi:hypothetical protein
VLITVILTASNPQSSPAIWRSIFAKLLVEVELEVTQHVDIPLPARQAASPRSFLSDGCHAFRRSTCAFYVNETSFVIAQTARQFSLMTACLERSHC